MKALRVITEGMSLVLPPQGAGCNLLVEEVHRAVLGAFERTVLVILQEEAPEKEMLGWAVDTAVHILNECGGAPHKNPLVHFLFRWDTSLKSKGRVKNLLLQHPDAPEWFRDIFGSKET